MLRELENVLDDYSKSYETSELERLVSRWTNAKDGLLSLLRMHPNYVEDAKAVILRTEDTRETDAAAVRASAQELLHYAEHAVTIPERVRSQLTGLFHYTNQFVDDPLKEQMDQASIPCKTGQKTSRLVNKIYTQLGADQLPEYNRLFAKLADSINPLKLPRTAALSVHPCDFLQMSNGTGWRSCHNLDGGEYQAGTLSYMTDSTSMVFYTFHDEYSGTPPFNEKKITRQIFAYRGGFLVQSRLYPNYEDAVKQKEYRAIVQKILAECLSVPNLWTMRAEGDISEYAFTHEDALHYPDYEYCSYHANVTCLKGAEESGMLEIGSPSYCVSCGQLLTDEDGVTCEDCSERIYCRGCDAEICHEDHVIYIDGDPYCMDCASYCECCEEYHTRESRMVSGGDYVCSYCLDQYYLWCGHCEEYFRIDDMTEYDGEMLCGDCLEQIQVLSAV